jgi:hypothetical protein
LFNPGWQERLGISYPDLMLPQTGETLNPQRIDELQNEAKPQQVIEINNK